MKTLFQLQMYLQRDYISLSCKNNYHGWYLDMDQTKWVKTNEVFMDLPRLCSSKGAFKSYLSFIKDNQVNYDNYS